MPIPKDNRHHERLKVSFTHQQIHEFGSELAELNARLTALEEEKKQLAARIAEDIASSKAGITKISRFIREGYDYNEVECTWKYHQPSLGMKTCFRTDTWEVIRQRDMDSNELQEELPFQQENA